MHSAWLIYNPSAGRFPPGPLLSRAVRVLETENWTVRVEETREDQDLADLANRAVEAGCEAVFVAGGDGSVGRVASTLAGSQTALGVLPSGTANVWAQELGLPKLDWIHWFALEEAAARLARGSVRLVDLGECNGRAFLLWAGLGLDAQVVNSIEPRERWEKAFATAHYATQVLWSSLGWDGVNLRVHALGRTWEDRFLMAVASNIRTYAGGLLALAPEARVDDGLLDFWLIGGRSAKDAVVRVIQIFRGTHVDATGVVHFQAGEATFEMDSPAPMHFDGEPGEVAAPLEFRVRRKVLRVLVPAEGGPSLFSAVEPTAE